MYLLPPCVPIRYTVPHYEYIISFKKTVTFIQHCLVLPIKCVRKEDTACTQRQKAKDKYQRLPCFFCLLSNTAAGQSELPRLRSEKAGLISPLPGRSEVTPCTGTAAHSNASAQRSGQTTTSTGGFASQNKPPFVRKEFELTTRTDRGHCGEQTLQLHATKREFLTSYIGLVLWRCSSFRIFTTSDIMLAIN